MEWHVYVSDLNPIEHAWENHGRLVVARNPPPRSTYDLGKMLKQEWEYIPQELLDILINSMHNQCQSCISVRCGRN